MKNNNVMKLEKSEIKNDILTKLNIKSKQDLRNFVLCSYLEIFSESDKTEIKLQVLRDMSKYIFNSPANHISMAYELKSEKSELNFDIENL